MKVLGFLIVLAGLAFYIAWPVYSGYEIRSALEAQDSARLSAKVDFTRLRASLRPAVTQKVEAVMAEALRNTGARITLNDDMKAKLMPGIVEAVLNGLVTPETLIRIHAQGGDIKTAIDTIVAERTAQADGLAGLINGIDLGTGGGTGAGADDKLGSLKKLAQKFGVDPDKALGGFLGKKDAKSDSAPAPVAAATPADSATTKPKYGYENIKHFGLNGPLGLTVGVARDAAAMQPDVTAEMDFVDGDWKLTGLVPRT